MIATYLANHYRSGVTVIGAAGARRSCADRRRRRGAASRNYAGAGRARPCAGALSRRRHAPAAAGSNRPMSSSASKALSSAAPGYYALQVFANAVGGGMSSRLFQEVREKRGLAYSVYSFHWGYADTRPLWLLRRDGQRRCAELDAASRSIVLAKAAEDLSEAEIHRAKAQMKVSLLTALESATARAEQIARQIAGLRPRSDARGNYCDKIDQSDARVRFVAAGAAALAHGADGRRRRARRPRSIRPIAFAKLRSG